MRSASPTACARAGSSAVARSRTSTGSTSAPSAAKCSTPIVAQRWKTSSPSGYDAVGSITTRGRARPVEASRSASISAMAGGTRRRRRGPRVRAWPRVYLRDWPDDARRQRWTLVAAIIGSGAVFLDGTVVNLALQRIGQELPASRGRRPRGPDLHRQRLPGGPRRPAHPRRRAVRPLRPATGLRHRPGRFAVTSALCGLAPTMEWLIVFRLLQGAAGALLVPGSLALINSASRAPIAAARSASGPSATSGTDPARPARRRPARRHHRLARRVPHQRPGPGLRAVGRPSATWRSRATWRRRPLRLARLGRRRDRRRWAVRRADPRQEQRLGRTRWRGSSIVVGVIALIAFPILMATPPNPLVPLELFRSRAFASINLATFFIYGALYVVLSYQGLVLQGTLGYTALGAGAVGIPIGILLTAPLDPDRDDRRPTRVTAVPRRPGRSSSPPGCCGTRACRPTRQPGSSPSTTRRPGSRRSTPSSTSCRPSLLTGLGMAMVVSPLVNTLMGSIPGTLLGPRVGDQQRVSRVGQPLARGAHLHRHQRDVLRDARRPGPRARHDRREASRQQFPPLNPPAGARRAAQAAAAPGVDRGLPPGDDRGGGRCSRSARRCRTSGCGRTTGDRRPGRGRSRGADRRPMSVSTPRDWDARTYDRVADPMTRWGTAVLDRLPLARGDRVLDAGCGTGRVTEQLLERMGRTAAPSWRSTARRRWSRRRGSGWRASATGSSTSSPTSGRPLPVDGLVDADPVDRHVPLGAGPRRPVREPRRGAAAGRLARRPVRRRRQHRDDQAGAGHDRRRLARSGPLRDACWPRRADSMRPASSTSSAGCPTSRPASSAGEPFETYLRTVVLGAHLERLPADERDAFVRAVADGRRRAADRLRAAQHRGPPPSRRLSRTPQVAGCDRPQVDGRWPSTPLARYVPVTSTWPQVAWAESGSSVESSAASTSAGTSPTSADRPAAALRRIGLEHDRAQDGRVAGRQEEPVDANGLPVERRVCDERVGVDGRRRRDDRRRSGGRRRGAAARRTGGKDDREGQRQDDARQSSGGSKHGMVGHGRRTAVGPDRFLSRGRGTGRHGPGSRCRRPRGPARGWSRARPGRSKYGSTSGVRSACHHRCVIA